GSPPTTSTPRVDSGVLSGLGARNVGSATMSGRISALAARNDGGKTTYFVGGAGGGVWQSLDGGTTFRPVFDRMPVQSIGAIELDPTNPKTAWVGTGESWVRNSVSVGDGIYKSTDGGETWKNMGLPESERIVRILVHPKDGNVVYACVPGKLWSDSPDRGLYRTSDGGQSWSLILKGSNLSTGCGSVTMDPKDPEVLFASLWDFRRKGWTFRSGGDGPSAPSGSGLFRTSDGGKSWTPLTAAANKGLPPAPWGRVEVAIAPSDPKIVYALVEDTDSALYRSADGGATWEKRDKSQGMVWRPFYFARLVVDPKNPDKVWKPGLGLTVSEDGGRSFAYSGGRAHGDWHDVWVDPDNPQHVAGGDDGGFWISWDGGTRWWKTGNLPVSQFYHVSADAKDPYQVYGGLQDNSNWAGDSAYPGGITNSRWENLGGGDGFWVVVDPSDPHVVYAESQGGYVTRVDRRTGVARDVQPKAGYREKLRFNWNTPIAASPTDGRSVYIGAQFLFRTRDKGDTWERISPDLTTNDPEKQKQEESGGVTVDNSSAEMHTTIYAISESPKDPGVIWVGTDDGNVQLTRDGGKSWTNVAPNVPGLPKGSWVSWVEASRFDAGTAYAAFDRHTYGDTAPWAYRTTDYGKSWTRIVGPASGVRGYAHVIREDTVKPSLLFLGTELGLWISVDGGGRWAEFKGGEFPSVAVRDLLVHPRENDLVIGTHGRGIWIVDDITPLRALTPELLAKDAAFLPGRPVQQRMGATGGWVEGDAAFVGENPAGGAVITWYQRTRHLLGPIKLEILDGSGKVVATLNPPKRRGVNRVTWSMQVPPPRVPRAATLAFGASQGPRVLPGVYRVRLTKGSEVIEGTLPIGLDRRAPYTEADRKEQFEAAMRVHALFGEMSALVEKIEAARGATAAKAGGLPDSDPSKAKLQARSGRLEEIRRKIVATKEGGAITGEERIREHADILYSALLGWEGKPARYQVERIDALTRELADVAKEFAALPPE
ncbi:MAG TPA: sialidase, partial [Thermoanaerobaculia bacterium]|nr:sialidase [Thermoanaerobaculia bacterium]